MLKTDVKVYLWLRELFIVDDDNDDDGDDEIKKQKKWIDGLILKESYKYLPNRFNATQACGNAMAPEVVDFSALPLPF
ncbi:hypothetical protein M0804_006182 [Polistes exclamans]|nr:hypothetical protein M0804_006182 [Polistes exclamans]